MKIEEGMYVRTIYGKISKIVNTQVVHYSTGDEIYYSDDEKYPNDCLCEREIVKKASHNPIDLIEVGDYVNGCKVCEIDYAERGKYVMVEDNDPGWKSMYFNNDIKSIVTKEQFSQMEYKVGE